MHALDEYLNKALKKQSLKSDRQLCFKLGVSDSVVSKWRKGKGYPSSEHMTLIADMAGENPEIALADLSYWRAAAQDEHKAAKVFFKIARHLRQNLHMLSIAAIALFCHAFLTDFSMFQGSSPAEMLALSFSNVMESSMTQAGNYFILCKIYLVALSCHFAAKLLQKLSFKKLIHSF